MSMLRISLKCPQCRVPFGHGVSRTYVCPKCGTIYKMIGHKVTFIPIGKASRRKRGK